MALQVALESQAAHIVVEVALESQAAHIVAEAALEEQMEYNTFLMSVGHLMAMPLAHYSLAVMGHNTREHQLKSMVAYTLETDIHLMPKLLVYH